MGVFVDSGLYSQWINFCSYKHKDLDTLSIYNFMSPFATVPFVQVELFSITCCSKLVPFEFFFNQTIKFSLHLKPRGHVVATSTEVVECVYTIHS